ncbi:MAG: tail fiber domain-containing protein, partial [Chitinophagaceae bacterium]
YNYVTNPILNGANNAYLYSTGNDFIIGNATATRPIRFFAGGYANSNERMRIDGTNGYIGISNTGPTEKLDITGNLRLSGAFMPNNLPGTTGFLLQSNGAGAAPTWIDSSPYLNSWRLGGNSVLANTLFGTINNFDVQFITNNIEKMRLTGTGFLGIGTSAPTNTLHVVGTNPLALTGLVTGTSLGTDSLLSITAGVVKKLPMTTFINNANTWSTVGNTGTTSGSNYLGTSTPQSLVLRTNGVQGIILDSIGNVGIGSAPIFTLTPNREKLLVDAGLNADNAFINVISGKASTNNYVQMNIQNRASGTSASSDVVATNDLGSETVNFIDMGINSSSFATGTITGAPHTAYLYATGNDFVIGNSTTGRPLRFYTTAGGINADAMRIDSAGRVGIGNIPTQKLDITGNLKFSGTLMPNNNAGLTGMFLQSMGPSAAPQWSDASSSAWQMTGNAGTTSGSNYLGTSTPQSFVMRTAGVQGIILDSLGNVGIGAAPIFTLTPNREKLLVDAGTIAANSFVNVISGKANTNSYVQVNIQNRSSGTAASSDIVATNNTGSETTNFIDMGINSTGNSSAGMLGGANTAYLFSTGADLVIGNSTNNNVIKFYTTFSNTETERMRLINTGLMPGGTGVHDLGGTANRWGTVYSANAANVSSDKRLKTNIENLPYGLKEVLALRPVSYNWKTTPNSNKMLGLIAQEARKIVPEIVVGDETKEMLSMKYDELIPVLINAIKEQQKQIDELKQQIKLLQK